MLSCGILRGVHSNEAHSLTFPTATMVFSCSEFTSLSVSLIALMGPDCSISGCCFAVSICI